MRESDPTPTYDLHVGPFDRIDGAEEQVKSSKASLLRKHGWEQTCKTPGSLWMWQKDLPDGRTMLVSTDTALRFAREEACDKVDPAEYRD